MERIRGRSCRPKLEQPQPPAPHAREDIISPQALSSLSAGAVSAMSAVGAAVLKRHKHAMDKKPEWFWHIFAKCEAKAARIAEQAARAPQACGDAAFIETYSTVA
jgi:hypothetical protein